MGKWQRHNYTSQTRAKRSALSQQVTTRHQQIAVHESITKQDRNNINDPQKKHRLGTVSKDILLEGLNRFNGALTSPLVQMWIKTHRYLVCMKDPNLSMHHLLEHINQDIKRRYSKDKDSTVNKTEYWSKRNPKGKHTQSDQSLC